MPDWDEDSHTLEKNLYGILSNIVRDAPLRKPPTRELAREWQRSFLSGLDTPNEAYVGAFRGENGLKDVGVRIGTAEGVRPSDVPVALARFESTLQALIVELDRQVPAGDYPSGRSTGSDFGCLRMGPRGVDPDSSVRKRQR